MPRVLFVDDEEAILEGLRSVLRSERKRLDMRFASSGRAALETLAKETFDVVVSDMRMPAMDGLDLLREVRRLHPQVARIILSGYTDANRAAEASTVAHQMLMKPCEAKVVVEVVDRALRVQALLSDSTLRQIVCGYSTLPSAPQTYRTLTAELAKPDVSAKSLAAIIERDMGMSGRVLHVANSAYYGFAQRISSIDAAIVRLGTNMLRHLALTLEVFKAWSVPGLDLESLERHAILTAGIARKLARSNSQAEAAFAAGLLHDSGKLLLMSQDRARFDQAALDAERSRIQLHEAEVKVIGVSHADIGGFLLALWDLPHEIVEPVALHHRRAPGRADGDTADLVALANVLANEILGPEDPGEQVQLLDGTADFQRLRELARAEADSCFEQGATSSVPTS